MTQFTECFCFNLTDTFTCYIEFFSQFLKRTGTAVVQTETEF